MAGNKRYKLVILEGASTEIMDLFTFFEERKQGAGDIFIDSLGDFLLKIEFNPESWQYAKTKNPTWIFKITSGSNPLQI
ncbi:MAG: hypothetical protein R3D00_25370 [Bacteroidia bacterium]